MMKLGLPYFGHIMKRQEPQGGGMLEKVEGTHKRERPNIRWIDSIKELTTLSLQEPSKAIEDRIFGDHSFRE